MSRPSPPGSGSHLLAARAVDDRGLPIIQSGFIIAGLAGRYNSKTWVGILRSSKPISNREMALVMAPSSANELCLRPFIRSVFRPG
jgi:hypothetical protein